MSEECTHDCETCGKGCNQPSYDQTNDLNQIGKVIGVISGKGGVGKSMVTASLATLMARRGYRVGILDADITGPSIPRLFGMTGRAKVDGSLIVPPVTHSGIKVMSINFLLDKEDAPVIWRGPVISGVIRQFWTDVLWGDLDYLFVDMPPGTGDAVLTVFQSLPVDGTVIVTTPQSMVNMIVKKAENMADAMNIPVLGFVENMSYISCPDCGKEINLFGESGYDYKNKLLARLPLDRKIASLADSGKIESINHTHLDAAADAVEKI